MATSNNDFILFRKFGSHCDLLYFLKTFTVLDICEPPNTNYVENLEYLKLCLKFIHLVLRSNINTGEGEGNQMKSSFHELYSQTNMVKEDAINLVSDILYKVCDHIRKFFSKENEAFSVEQNYALESLFNTYTEIMILCIKVAGITSIGVDLLNHLLIECAKKISYLLQEKQEANYRFKILLGFLCSILNYVHDEIGSSVISCEAFKNVLSLLQFGNSDVASFVIVNVLPLVFSQNECDKIEEAAECIWSIVCTLFSENKSILKSRMYLNVFVLLCSLSDYLFSEQSEYIRFTMHTDIRFWKVLQCGLLHNHTFTRKRALYVFKRFLCHIQRLDHCVVPSECDTIHLFCYDSKFIPECKNIWEDVILLLEVLEEKQVHVIKPILCKLDKILKFSTKSGHLGSNLHTSWLVLLLHRMFKHDSKYIVNWSILYAVGIMFEECPILEQSSSELFLTSLIESLNDSHLYSRPNKKLENSSLSSENLSELLKKCCNSFTSTERKVSFLRQLLRIISRQSWGGVPLLYITCALTRIPSVPSWKSTDFISIREVVYHAQRTQDPLLRGAIQCYLIKATFHHMSFVDTTFEDLSLLLNVFKGKECFLRHSSQWKEFVSWLLIILESKVSETISVDSAYLFCVNSVKGALKNILLTDDSSVGGGTKRIARMIVILADASVICSNNCSIKNHSCLMWSSLLAPIVYTIQTAPSRPYLDNETFLTALEFYCNIFEECKGNNASLLKDEHMKSVVEYLLDGKDTMNFIFSQVFSPITKLQDVSRLCLILKVLYKFSEDDQLCLLMQDLLSAFVEKCMKIFEQDSKHCMMLQLWKALAWICHLLSQCSHVLQSVQSSVHFIVFQAIERKFLIQPFLKPDFISGNAIKAEWTKLTSSATTDAWFCAKVCFQNTLCDAKESFAAILVNQAIEAFNVGPRLAVHSVLNCLKEVMSHIVKNNEQLVCDIMNIGWKACLELRRSDLFHPAVKAFISMAFQPVLMRKQCVHLLDKFVDEFREFGENSSVVFSSLVDHCLSNSWQDFLHTQLNFNKLVALSLTFGSIHRKEQRLADDAATFVIKQGDLLAVNQLLRCDNKTDVSVRVKAINLIRSMSVEDPQHQGFSENIIDILIQMDIEARKIHSVHFGNSFTHRLKNRIWQSILILQPFISLEYNKKLLQTIFELLSDGNQQPSVRYLQEWVVTKILIEYPDLLNHLSLSLQEVSEKRLGSVISFFSILVHISRYTTDLESLASIWFPILILHSMSQNFNVRIYAQVAINHLWELCKLEGMDNILQKFDYIEMCLKSQRPSVCSGNASKIRLKLSSDFYFTSFDPIKDFTLQTIFYELPCLSNLTCEEWISPELFESSTNEFSSSVLMLYNSDSQLRDCDTSSWISEASNSDIQTDDIESFNFQKKITPWKQMIFDMDKEQNVFVSRKAPVSGKLIVVASLIDKTPNLGGLCRTSEIFGVREFIIGNMKLVEDKQFQNLAVTANKWINIKEVKPYNLKDYLLSMKQKGYILIGAEQTDDSQLLTNYLFPEKSLILLGNEKEGIPVNLIQILDFCVQIPQIGIVRSLNVHVSGAILIWEYTRQIYLSQKS